MGLHANPRLTAAWHTHGSTLKLHYAAVGPITIITALKPRQFVSGMHQRNHRPFGPAEQNQQPPLPHHHLSPFHILPPLSSASLFPPPSLLTSVSAVKGIMGGILHGAHCLAFTTPPPEDSQRILRHQKLPCGVEGGSTASRRSAECSDLGFSTGARRLSPHRDEPATLRYDVD